ncbi:MAG: energy transducer TonB [Gammaproteobacteria bacterium]
MDQTKDSSTLVLGVLGALLLVVGGGWLFLSFGGSTSAPSSVQTATPAPLELPDEDIDPKFDLGQNLDMGQMALDAGQLVEPPDGSALYFFLSALAQDGDSAKAQLGLRSISDQMAVDAREQLAGEDFAALDQSLRVLRRINIADPNLLAIGDELTAVIDAKVLAIEGAIRRGQWVPAQALLDQVNTIPGVDRLLTLEIGEGLSEAQALAAEAAAAAQATAAAAAAAAAAAPEADGDAADGDDATPADGEDADETPADFRVELFEQLQESIDAERLLLPSTSSAAYYLAELTRVAPDDSSIATGREALVSALISRGVARGQSGNFAAAATAFEAAATYDADSAALSAAVDALRNAQLAAESARIIPVGELVNTKVVRPRYPSRALRNETEGYVLLHFTVLEDGTTSEIELIEASDRYSEQFERSARAAVSQWEFVPRQFEGEVIAQRVEARVSFEIDP